MTGTPNRPLVDRLRDQLTDAAARGRVFAVIDAARVPGLPSILSSLGLRAECLAARVGEEDLSAVAPYLVVTDPSELLFAWYDAQPEVVDASLFVVTDRAFEDIRRHLKRFLRVEGPDGTPLYFRFYDPRILEPLLLAFEDEERALLFGPVHCLLARDPCDDRVSHGRPLLEWRAPAGACAVRPLPDAFHSFRLRADHMEALGKDAMRRYRRRVAAYLRSEHADRLVDATDDAIDARVDEAIQLGRTLGLETGREVTLLTEVLVLGGRAQELAAISAPNRAAALVGLRDRLEANGGDG